MKKLASIFLAALTAISSFCVLSACNTQELDEARLPDYLVERDETKEFKIGSWVGVPNYVVSLDSEKDVVLGSAREMTDEEFIGQYRVFKESGIGIMYPGEWKCSVSDGGPYSGNYTTDSRFIKRMLAAAKETGVKQLIRDYTLNGILKNAKLSDEEAVAAAKEAVSYYIDEPALFGHLIEDEPVLNEMEESRLALKRYKMAFPELEGLVNLCPIIGEAKYFTDENWDETQCTAYEYYVDSFMKDNDFTDYVSYDHYPLFGNNETKRTSLEPTFLYAMDIVGRRAKKSGKEMWTYLQSIGYGAVNRIPVSVGDISFQAYSFMAYGGKMISWFCYWSPVRFDGLTYFTEAMIELDGTKTAVYDYVATVNREILSFDDIYLNFDWQGVMTRIGRENKMGENDNFAYIEDTVLKSHDRISRISCEQDTLIGVFKDEEERDGFMVVNFTDPGKGLKNEVALTFNDAKFAFVVQNGHSETVRLENGALKLALDVGDGAFVIPLD